MIWLNKSLPQIGKAQISLKIKTQTKINTNLKTSHLPEYCQWIRPEPQHPAKKKSITCKKK